MTIALILNDIDTEAVVQQWVIDAASNDELQSRREPRFPFLNAAAVSCDGVEQAVMCRDLSKKGIGIIQYGGLPQRGPATLSVLLRKQVVFLDVELSWAKDMGNGWRISGGNLNFASIDAASLLLLRMSTAMKRRIHERLPFCHAFSIYAKWELDTDCIGVENISPKDETLAVSLDLSLGGMRCICFEPLDYNQEFVYVRKIGGNTMIRSRVISRKPLGNGYFAISVQFDID